MFLHDPVQQGDQPLFGAGDALLVVRPAGARRQAGVEYPHLLAERRGQAGEDPDPLHDDHREAAAGAAAEFRPGGGPGQVEVAAAEAALPEGVEEFGVAGDRDAEGAGHSLHRHIVVGAADAAGGEHQVVALAQRLHLPGDRRRVVADGDHPAQLQALRSQQARQHAGVRVGGLAGEDLVADDEERGGAAFPGGGVRPGVRHRVGQGARGGRVFGAQGSLTR